MAKTLGRVDTLEKYPEGRIIENENTTVSREAVVRLHS